MKAEKQKTSRCSVEGDLELVRRYQSKDREAGETLVKGHFGFIRVWAYRFSDSFSWVAWDDLVQLSTIGFWKAAKEFEVLVYRFFHPWATRLMWLEIRKSPEVTVDKRIPRGNNKLVKTTVEELMRELHRMPTLEEISERTKLTPKQVDKALIALARSMVSLEDEDGPMEIEDRRQIEKLNEIENQRQEIYQLLREAINRLTPGQRKVIEGYYFSEPTTDRAIAEELGMEKSAVTRRRGRAEETLRKIISGDRRWNPRILNSF